MTNPPTLCKIPPLPSNIDIDGLVQDILRSLDPTDETVTVCGSGFDDLDLWAVDHLTVVNGRCEACSSELRSRGVELAGD